MDAALHRPLAGLAAALLAGCAGTAAPPAPAAPPAAAASPLVRQLLASHPGLESVLADAAGHRLQVVVGLVEPGPGGRPVLVQHGFRLGAEYSYPASAVKLFAAVAALERLAELRRETGLPIDLDTPLVFHPLFAGEEVEDRDPSNLDGGRITVRHEIRKLFLVSDNQAFNRLYELVGQDRLAASLARAGIAGGRVVHRLDEARSEAENRRSPRIDLVGDGFRHTLPEREAPPLPPPEPLPGLLAGRAHFAGGARVDRPFDFTAKNRFPLADLQRGLCRVVRPDVDCGGPGFALADGDRAVLVEAMRQLPRESANPRYDPAEVPDDFVKFVLPGLRRVVGGERLEVYDKSGQAYGFTTENAYVVDRGGGRPFFLAATLYTNADEVLNDDRYEYAEVALPFLADLGEAAARWLWGDGSTEADER
ncbi:MAG TPA: serine hydrolase [Thermoanaerobaculia bacterium]